ncbi:MAG: cytochrome c3 family protein [bacterium]
MDEPRAVRPVAGRRWYLVLGLTFAVLAALLYLFYQFPRRDLGPKQPIPFSHRIHAGVKRIDCRFCHPYVNVSEAAGLPEMKKCFFCHEYIIPKHPWIVKERKHWETGEPVRWIRVFFVPDHVQFTHEPHMRFAKLECVECHGQVENMDRIPRVNFLMGFCIDCHKRREAQIDCWLACHY